MSNIVVQPVQNQAIIRATEIAERLDLPLVTQADAGQQFVLEVSLERLAIRDRRQLRTLPVQVACSNLRRPSHGRDLLARAIGRKNETINVKDNPPQAPVSTYFKPTYVPYVCDPMFRGRCCRDNSCNNNRIDYYNIIKFNDC